MRYLRLLGLAMLVGLAAQTAFGRTQGSEAQMAAGLQDKIYHSHVFDHGQVQAALENGVATLTGTVDSLGAKLDAERAARKAPGVVQVIDRIQVRAKDATAAQILEAARKQVVTYYAYGIFDNVVLQAEGDKLTLSGQVTQPFKKQDLGNLLAHLGGVATLENNLEVLPASFFDDGLRLAVARAIYGDPLFVRYGVRVLPPIHIIVKNGNVALEGAVATPLDRIKAGMDASLAGLSFSLVNNLHVDRG
jgi:osmotically-inducible protein OsmY